MERSEISQHEVAVYQVLKKSNNWMTNKAIAVATKAYCPVAERTVRCHTKRFLKLGIIDLVEVFPAHVYKLSNLADKRNAAYMQRLEQALAIFNKPQTVITDVY